LILSERCACDRLASSAFSIFDAIDDVVPFGRLGKQFWDSFVAEPMFLRLGEGKKSVLSHQ
jgi:hypothetical protein